MFVGATFASRFQDKISEINKPEMEVEDGLEISAGHIEKIGVQRYGVPSNIVKHLSMRSIKTFHPLRQKRPHKDEVKEIRPVVPQLHRPQPTVSSPPLIDIDSEAIRQAMQKALGQTTMSFRSREQKEVIAVILTRRTPLVVILPTGGRKNLLFMAPTYLDDAKVTIVVVPFRALMNDLLQQLLQADINCLEWKYGKVNAASIVIISADVAGN
ncbi:hypothetical protein PISL3812_08990 [Talaromyces islandicus]|uniref:DEAD/DEAH-box helicase domain-containing protein n=1 Tax=Talaromyces islandicus TaxID=28573 RepID=A0A0U1MAJ6_TALIS|nr:hypothetical protein PISL3812_08990 [Talaromyces islandicus]